MSHKMLRPFIVKVFVLGHFPYPYSTLPSLSINNSLIQLKYFI